MTAIKFYWDSGPTLCTFHATFSSVGAISVAPRPLSPEALLNEILIAGDAQVRGHDPLMPLAGLAPQLLRAV